MDDENTSLSSGPQRSRARRFDAPRFSRSAQAMDASDSRSLIQEAPEPDEETAEPTAPDPQPAEAAPEPVALSDVLRELKWSESDIARILVGPRLSHLTAEGLFRQHAANPPADQARLVDALQRAGAPKVERDPSLLSGLNPNHLLPETPADLTQIISQFAQLPDVQKRRFLSLLDEQKISPQSGGNEAPRTGAKPPKPMGNTPAKKEPANKADDVLSTVLKGSFDTLDTIIKGLLGSKGSGKGSPSSPKGSPSRGKGSDSEEKEDPTTPADNESEETESEGTTVEPSSSDDSEDAEDSETSDSTDTESNDIPYGPPSPDELSSELGGDREPD